MKKILSVALSTAMAFSMFASVAFGAESLTPQQQFDALKAKGILNGYADGSAHLEKTITRAELAKVIVKVKGLKEITGVYSFNDKNYKKDAKWPAPYIEAVAAAGIMKGDNEAKKIFNFNGNVSVEELATVLVRALNLEVPTTGIDNSATKWAQGYVQAAINAGLLEKNLNFQAAATRSQVVVAAYTIDQKSSIPTVASYKVVDANNVEFTLSNGEVVKVKLDKALEANKETAVEFKDSKGNTIATKVTYVVTTATKVQAVTANNLKEIEVAFDGTVDQASAEDKDKYSVDSSVQIDSATLLADGKTVRLAVKEVNGNVLQNQKAYKLSVRNVKAGDKTVDVTNFGFTPIDNALPEVSEVKALGTKAIKVTFSEPIKTASSTNFKLDGKSFFGSVTAGAREVVLKPYSSTDLSVGAHKLEVSGVEDYNKFKALTKEVDFTVAEDTTAPTVVSNNATLERVTLTFSEEVDPDTINASNVYWKSGNDKKEAGSFTRISSTVYAFDFTKNSLPGYETSLFVEGVKDYSGNQIKETEVKVKAELDRTQPEVTEVSISSLDNTKITLKFNKQVRIEDVKYFTLTKSNGDVVPVRSVVGANGTSDDKVFTLSTYGALDSSYTLKISGVRDTTKLQNTMSDYSTKLTGKDTKNPEYTSNSGSGRVLVINFSKELELASAGSAGNYLVVINNKTQQLPAGTEVTPLQNGKSVRIVFPEYIDNARVGINESTAGANVTAFQLLALKDVAGNIITNFGAAPVAINSNPVGLAAKYDDDTTQPAKLTSKGVIKVRFDQPIGQATASDFEVTGGTGVSIGSVTTDASDIVTVTLSGTVNETGLYDAAGTPITIGVKANSAIKSVTGLAVATAATNIAVKDGVKPVVQLQANQTRLIVDNNKINLPFSEKLSGNADNYKYDLVVTNARTGDRLPVTNYTTTLGADGKSVDITIGVATTDEYKVSVIADASEIKDVDGNKAAASSVYWTQVGKIDTTPAPTVTGVTENGLYKTDVAATFTAGTATLSKDGAAAVAYTTGTPISVDGTYKLVVTNQGKSTTVNFKVDKTAPTFTATKTGAKQITVVFSEAVKKADAENVANYVFDTNGAAADGTEVVLSAALGTDNKTVVLTTTTDPAAGATIDATVEDLAGNTSASAPVAL